MSVSKDEVSDLIRENNKQLMDSFKDLLAQSVGQIKRSNEDSAEQQMKAIKKLKYDEPHKFKKKANEDHFNFNRKLAENIGTAKSAAEISQLEKVKSDLAEDPRPLEPRRRPQVRSFNINLLCWTFLVSLLVYPIPAPVLPVESQVIGAPVARRWPSKLHILLND